MILRLIALIPIKQWSRIQYTINPEGKKSLANWLRAEKNQKDKYVLDYQTPELRRISNKLTKGLASEDEIKLLKNSKKRFIGNLINNKVIYNKKAIEIINQDLMYIEKFNDLINQLEVETINSVNNDVLILGERLTNININPRKFVELVYSQIYQVPEWVLSEIKSLIDFKLMNNRNKLLFEDIELFEDKLKRIGIDINKTSDSYINLCKVEVDESINTAEVVQAIIQSFSSAYKLDNEFDYDVYKELKDIFPQYHNVNVTWLMNFYSSYIGSYKPYVSSLITFEMLGALYRKGVELTC